MCRKFEVVSSIRRATDIMGEITSASVEQSQGAAKAGEAVTQRDQATQQNAALVEESAAAAESLKLQAEKTGAGGGGVQAAGQRGRAPRAIAGCSATGLVHPSRSR